MQWHQWQPVLLYFVHSLIKTVPRRHNVEHVMEHQLLKAWTISYCICMGHKLCENFFISISWGDSYDVIDKSIPGKAVGLVSTSSNKVSSIKPRTMLLVGWKLDQNSKQIETLKSLSISHFRNWFPVYQITSARKGTDWELR